MSGDRIERDVVIEAPIGVVRIEAIAEAVHARRQLAAGDQ
jgi:hypothetical protein